MRAKTISPNAQNDGNALMEKEVQEITEAKPQVAERDLSSHTPMMQQYLRATS
jgi:hypothetical protein